MDIRSFLEAFLERPWVVAVRTILDIYGRAAGGLLANGLAFAALFAAIPTTLLVLGLVGFAAGDPAVQADMSEAIAAAFPPVADLIRGAVDAIADGAALTSVVGVVGLIWTVSQLYGAVDTAFARIYSDDPERDAVRRTVLGFVTVGLLAAVVVAVIAALGALAALDALSNGSGSLARGAIAILISPPVLAVLGCAAVAVAYRRLPPRSPSWKALLIPAVAVGAILVVLSQAFSILVPRLVGVASLAGPLASAFADLAWLSLSFQAFLFGAAWVRVRSEGPPTTVAAGSGGSAALERPAPTAEPGGRRE